MQIAFKSDVRANDVSWQIGYALRVAEEVYNDLNAQLTVTSLTDGVHNPGSLHPKGKATDIRVINLTPADRLKAFDAIKKILDPLGYDVVWEGGVGATPATTGAHIHIEYDPKKGENAFLIPAN